MNPLLLKAGGIAAVVAIALMSKCGYDHYQQGIGAAKLETRTARAERDTLRLQLDSLSRASRVQVETLRVAVVRRVSVRDTVERWLRDTVPVPVEVVRQIVVADSQVIAACTIALRTCEQEKATLREDNRLIAVERDAYKKLIPSAFRRTTTTTRDAIIGAALCWFLCPKR